MNPTDPNNTDDNMAGGAAGGTTPPADDANANVPSMPSTETPAEPVVDPGTASAPPVQTGDDSATEPTSIGGGMAGVADETPATDAAPMAGTGAAMPGDEEKTEDGGGTGTPAGPSSAA